MGHALKEGGVEQGYGVVVRVKITVTAIRWTRGRQKREKGTRNEAREVPARTNGSQTIKTNDPFVPLVYALPLASLRLTTE